MTNKLLINTGGILPAGTGYGPAAALPDFGAGYAGFLIGSLLNDNTTIDVFGSGRTATMVGTPGPVGLLASATDYFDLGVTGRTLFSIGNAATFAMVAKAPATQALLADSATGGMSLLTPSGGGGSQAFSYDGVNSANSTAPSTLGTDNATRWSLFIATFTLTKTQAFIQRSGAARIASTAVTKASGAVGSTTLTLRHGRTFSAVAQASTAAIIGAWTKELTSLEMDVLFANCAALMADAGETL